MSFAQGRKLALSPKVTLALYLIAEITSRAAPFLLIPYFSRLLGATGFGELSLYYGNIVLFSALFSLSLDVTCAQYFYKKGERKISNLIYISQAYYLLLFFFSIILLIFNVNSFTLAFTTSVSLSFYMLLLIQKQARKYVLQYILCQLSYSLLFVVLSCSLIYYFKSYISVAIAQLMAYSILILIISNKEMISMTRATSFRYYKYIISFGGPLIFHKSSVYIRDGLERYFVFLFFSSYTLGVFFAAKQLALIILVLITVINRALSPYIMESLKNNKLTSQMLASIFSFLILLFLIIYYALYVFITPEVMGFIFGDDYSDSYKYVPQVVLGALLYLPYTISVNILYFHKKVKSISLVTFCISLLHVGYVYYFSLEVDLLFMSYSTVISNSLISLCIFFIASKTLKDQVQ
ncbi:MAG: oligosaccharide flippase family protein [Colwellia polaris]